MNLTIGVKDQDVLSILGSPSDILDLGKYAKMWVYDFYLEFYIELNYVKRINLKYNNEIGNFSFPNVVSTISDKKFEKLNSIYELIEVLDQNDIQWEVNPPFCDDTNICLLCNDCVEIYYDLVSHNIVSIQARAVDFWIEQNTYWSEKNKRN